MKTRSLRQLKEGMIPLRLRGDVTIKFSELGGSTDVVVSHKPYVKGASDEEYAKTPCTEFYGSFEEAMDYLYSVVRKP